MKSTHEPGIEDKITFLLHHHEEKKENHFSSALFIHSSAKILCKVGEVENINHQLKANLN